MSEIQPAHIHTHARTTDTNKTQFVVFDTNTMEENVSRVKL